MLRSTKTENLEVDLNEWSKNVLLMRDRAGSSARGAQFEPAKSN